MSALVNTKTVPGSHDPSCLSLIPFALGDVLKVNFRDRGVESYTLGYVKRKQGIEGTFREKRIVDPVALYDVDGYVIAYLVDGTFTQFMRQTGELFEVSVRKVGR